MTIAKIAEEIVDSILNHPDCNKSLGKDWNTLIILTQLKLETGLKDMFRTVSELMNLQP